MYKNKRICAVIPAHNEETQIGRVIETMPDYMDLMIIIDDKSSDNTVAIIQYYQKQNFNIHLIQHETNKGVGGAIATGYKYARDNELDVAVVMAGDAQMAPEDLPAILDPVVEDRADYSKGNRLFTGEAYQKIPKTRYFGNAFLSLLTKIASGYWHVADSQSGYTAINKKALKVKIPKFLVYIAAFINEKISKDYIFNRDKYMELTAESWAYKKNDFFIINKNKPKSLKEGLIELYR